MILASIRENDTRSVEEIKKAMDKVKEELGGMTRYGSWIERLSEELEL